MTIQTKFTVLLALLGLTVAIGLGSALFFGRVLEREIVEPLRSSAEVMSSLTRLKRDVGALTRLLPGPGRDVPGVDAVDPDLVDPRERGQLAAAYEERLPAVRADLDALLDRRLLAQTVGISTARNLHSRIEESWALAAAWFERGDLEAGRAAGLAHYEIHELIERIEGRLLENAGYAFDHATAMRRMHSVILASGIAGTLLFVALTAMLVQRWVVKPVGELRRAAAEIGKGNFSYTVAVEGEDELGQLAREVQHMSGAIARMQEEAVERERLAAVGEMVRRIAHNIRNPLAGIRSVAELSRRRAEPGSPIHTDQTEIMQTVDRFNQWLGELLRATSPLKVEPREAAPARWLEGIAESHTPLARMREVALRCDTTEAPPTAWYDSRHLEHAIVAILTNALQASPAGGQVLVRTNADAQAGTWDIAISDQGPGIPPDLLEKVFRPYFTTKKDGNGIGLASALQTVKQHGGQILVETAENRGTTFIVRLPLGGIQSGQVAEISQMAGLNRNGATSGDDPGHRG